VPRKVVKTIGLLNIPQQFQYHSLTEKGIIGPALKGPHGHIIRVSPQSYQPHYSEGALQFSDHTALSLLVGQELRAGHQSNRREEIDLTGIEREITTGRTVPDGTVQLTILWCATRGDVHIESSEPLPHAGGPEATTNQRRRNLRACCAKRIDHDPILTQTP
jgi:hypothetical protein